MEKQNNNQNDLISNNKKENLFIQTREQYRTDTRHSKYYNQDKKKRDIEQIKRDIERYKIAIKENKKAIKEIRHRSNKSMSYASWVNQVRQRNIDRYNIIENEDSKKIKVSLIDEVIK